MIAIGAILLGAAGGLLVLERRAARKRRQVGGTALDMATLRQEAYMALRQPGSLRVEADDLGFTVDATDDRWRTALAGQEVKNQIDLFVAQPSEMHTLSDEERREFAPWAPGDAPRDVAIYRLPLRFTTAVNTREPAGFAAFLEAVRQLPERISLPELSDASEKAYIDTRPDGFDLHAYYMSRR